MEASVKNGIYIESDLVFVEKSSSELLLNKNVNSEYFMMPLISREAAENIKL